MCCLVSLGQGCGYNTFEGTIKVSLWNVVILASPICLAYGKFLGLLLAQCPGEYLIYVALFGRW